jgi:hypothetical protein
LIARQDLRAIKVAAIGDGFQLIRLKNGFRLLRHVRQV